MVFSKFGVTSLAIALKQLIELKGPFTRLALSWPKVLSAGAPREDLTKHPLRFWTVQAYPNYIIVCDPGTDPLQIIRILHSTRHIVAILSDSKP